MSRAKTKQAAKKKGNKEFSFTGNLLESMENFVGRMKDYQNRYIVKPYETGRELVADFREAPRKTFVSVVEDGKALMGDVKEDAFERVNEYVKNSRDHFERLPLVKKLDKHVVGMLKAIPAKVNLPSKAEIRKLTRTVDALNKKMDQLNKNCSA
jgi:hypothetical protein